MKQKRNARKAAVAASALAAVLFLAVPAGASAVTIGDTFAPEPGCAAVLHLQSTSPGDEYAAPSAGVITSWSYQAGASPVPLKLKVGRHVGGDDFRIVGESPVETPLANQLNTFPVQIAVQAGDVIGNFMTASGECFDSSPGPGYAFHHRAEDVPPGTTATFFGPVPWKLDIAANLETQPCAGRAPTIAGTDGDDSLTGTNGDDSIVGLDGDDEIGAAGGEDCLSGDAGRDVLRGGAGHDIGVGGGGKDKLRGQNGRDKLKGNAGNDKVNGGNGKDKLKGNAGNDKLRGAGAKDKIKGNAGNDRVGAQDGKRDRVNCGGGNDRAVVDPIDKVKNCETVKVVDAD